MNEPQQQFNSGNRSYHCLHTQMVVDTTGIIKYIESGFMCLNKFKKIRGMTDFSDQFRKIIMRYKRIGYNLNVM